MRQLDREYLPSSLRDIYEEMNPNNFGRIIAYLTLVYKVSEASEEETIREAVKRTVIEFKHNDLDKYKVKRLSFNTLLGQLFIRLVFAYFARKHM